MDAFAWTSLFPERTGLPCVIWVSAQGAVATNPCDPAELAHREAVTAWIELNRGALIAHWRGEVDGAEMEAATKPVT